MLSIISHGDFSSEIPSGSELIIEKESTVDKSWNKGLKEAHGNYVMFVTDSVKFCSKEVPKLSGNIIWAIGNKLSTPPLQD